jgi:hypothetical protein
MPLLGLLGSISTQEEERSVRGSEASSLMYEII